MASSSALHLREWIQSMSRWQLREFGARAFSQDLRAVEQELRGGAERASGEASSVAASLGGSSRRSSGLSAASLDYGDLSADESAALEPEDR
jgi:hypothetical protein